MTGRTSSDSGLWVWISWVAVAIQNAAIWVGIVIVEGIKSDWEQAVGAVATRDWTVEYKMCLMTHGYSKRSLSEAVPGWWYDGSFQFLWPERHFTLYRAGFDVPKIVSTIIYIKQNYAAIRI